MLISFLASLEDGVSYRSEVAEHRATEREGEGEGRGKASLPGLATLLGLTLSAEGGYKRRSLKEEGVDSKFMREHTAASLFNRLRARLKETPDAVKYIGSPDSFGQLEGCVLAEMRGEIVGNPLNQILDLLSRIGPYIGIQLNDTSATPDVQPSSTRDHLGKGGKPRTTPTKTATPVNVANDDLNVTNFLRILKSEVDGSPVTDLLMQGTGEAKAILTVNREILSPEVSAYLVGSRVNVLAKVSSILPGGESLNLLRRTAFGYAGRAIAEEMIGNFDNIMSTSGQVDLALTRAVINGPAIQLLPLAIYL
jgi:hypothetical protein